MSRLLKKLVEAGEVREGFGEDAREKVLMLTEKGRGTLAGIDVCLFHFAPYLGLDFEIVRELRFGEGGV